MKRAAPKLASLSLVLVILASLLFFASPIDAAPNNLWAWGNNQFGQLGYALQMYATEPVQIAAVSGAVNVGGGRAFSLAVKKDGTVWCWGNDTSSQLGDGGKVVNVTNQADPVQAAGLTNAVAVCGGRVFSMALLANGTVYAWGNNTNGQLGDGTNTNRNAPVKTSGLSNAIAIATGNQHSLALSSNGTVWAWGSNSNGQVGDGTTQDSLTPIQVKGLSGVQAIAVGSFFSLACKSDGTVWAWGSNSNGQLGDGTTTDQLTHERASGISRAKSALAGNDFSVAIKKPDGTVWSWGDNYSG